MFGFTFAQAQEANHEAASKTMVVKATCGMCNFDMEGGCQLAVKIDGEHYFVDGTTLKSHGDPHSEHGMCNTVREAEVSGEIVDGRFKAETFVLLPYEADE